VNVKAPRATDGPPHSHSCCSCEASCASSPCAHGLRAWQVAAQPHATAAHLRAADQAIVLAIRRCRHRRDRPFGVWQGRWIPHADDRVHRLGCRATAGPAATVRLKRASQLAVCGSGGGCERPGLREAVSDATSITQRAACCCGRRSLFQGVERFQQRGRVIADSRFPWVRAVCLAALGPARLRGSRRSEARAWSRS
jgi:hypothetical protein